MQDRTEDFKTLWASHFKKLNVSDGIDHYLAFVFKADWNMLVHAVELLSTKYQEDKKGYAGTAVPNLGTLKSTYFELKNQDKSREFKGNCFTCQNTGYVIILLVNRQHCNPKQPFPCDADMIDEYVGSCTCSLGEYDQPQRARNANVLNSFGPVGGFPNNPVTTQERIRAYIKSCHEMYLQKLQQQTEAAQAVAGG